MVGLLLLVTALGFCSVKNKCQQRGETWQSSSLGRPAMAAEGPIVVSVGLCFSAFTGALFRMHLGLSGLAGGFLFGTAFGIPAGGLLMIAQKLAGETLQEKRNRERREQYEQKLAEWQSRLSVTEDLGKMESDARGQSQTENSRRI